MPNGFSSFGIILSDFISGGIIREGSLRNHFISYQKGFGS